MTAALDEAALRRWLVDYLVTNIGCSPDEIDLDASFNDLAVGSRDAVVLSVSCRSCSAGPSRPSSSGSTRRSMPWRGFSAGPSPNPSPGLRRW